MKKILLIFGTRPEAIKMASLVKEFQKYPEIFDTRVCVTAQHREMLDQVLDFFEIKPDYDLDLMMPGQNLYSLTANIIESLKPILEEFSPDFVFLRLKSSWTPSSRRSWKVLKLRVMPPKRMTTSRYSHYVARP